MPSINLLDNLGLDISIAGASGDSTLAKYLCDDLNFIFDLPTFVSNQTLAVSKVADSILPFTLSAKLSSNFGFGGVGSLCVTEGASASIGILKDDASAALLHSFGKEPASPPVYLSFETGANVQAAAQGSVNEFTFGMIADGDIEVTNYRACAADSSLLEATKATISGFTLPVRVEDLQEMNAGTVFEVSGNGALTFSAAAGYQFLNNALATVKVPFIDAPAINAAGSADLQFSVKVFGGFQVSVLKDSQKKVYLAVTRSRGKKFAADFSVTASLELDVEGTDLLAVVLGQITPDPGQIEKLKNVPEENRTEIEAALKLALQSNFAAGIEAGVSRQTEADVLFLYEINLNELKVDGKKAVAAALRGNYGPISVAAAAPGSGILEQQAIYTHQRKISRTLTIHLLNLFQFTDLSSLVLNGTVQVSPESGALVLTDTATANQIRARTSSLYSDPNKLRALLFTSAVITAAYQGSKALVGAPALSFQFEFFSMHADTHRDVMRHELATLATLGAISVPAMNSILGNGTGKYGPTSLNIAIRLDPVHSERLFLIDHRARTFEAYESVGRNALLAALQCDEDPTSQARVDQLKSQAAWERVRDILNNEGDAGFEREFRNVSVPVRFDIKGDHEAVAWWAEAMSGFATALQNIEALAAGQHGFNPGGDAFKKLQRDLEQKAARIVSTTKDRFDLPWGALAIYFCLSPQIDVDASFTSAALTLPSEAQTLTSTAGG